MSPKLNEKELAYKKFLIDQINEYNDKLNKFTQEVIVSCVQPNATINAEKMNQIFIKKTMLLWFMELLEEGKPVNLERVPDMSKKASDMMSMAVGLLKKVGLNG